MERGGDMIGHLGKINAIAPLSLNVLELIEYHEFDGDECVIVGANIPHINVDLRWNVTKLSEHVLTRNQSFRIAGVRK